MGNQYCGNCGAPFDPRTGICPNCGAKRIIRETNDAPTVNADNYRYQNFQNRFEDAAGGDYRRNAGAPAYRESALPANVPNRGGGKKNSASPGLIAAIVVAVVAAAVVAVLLILVIGNARKKDNSKSGAGEATGIQTTLEGVLSSETFNGNEIYVLNLDRPREFHPKGEDAAVFGSTLTESKVQIVSNIAAGYVGRRVRVDGIQRCRSETAHRYNVIMVDVDIGDLGAVTTTAAQTQPTVTATVPVTTVPPIPVTTQPPAVQTPKLPIPVDFGVNLIAAEMEASTSHPANGERSYTPDKANDMSAETCWMAYNPKKNGAGVWIRLNFGEKKLVSAVAFLNGNCWNDVDDVYHLNGRVCDFTVSYDGGEIAQGTASDVRGKITYLTFPEPVEASYIKLYVDSTYKGSKNDTVVCISELHALSPD